MPRTSREISDIFVRFWPILEFLDWCLWRWNQTFFVMCPGGSRTDSCGQTDRTKLIWAFRDLTKVLKNSLYGVPNNYSMGIINLWEGKIQHSELWKVVSFILRLLYPSGNKLPVSVEQSVRWVNPNELLVISEHTLSRIMFIYMYYHSALIQKAMIPCWRVDID